MASGYSPPPTSWATWGTCGTTTAFWARNRWTSRSETSPPEPDRDQGRGGGRRARRRGRDLVRAGVARQARAHPGPYPVRSWLERPAEQVRTLGVTHAMAETATSLPASFPRDPADRLIYATAIEHGLQLVSKDERLRAHPHSRPIVIW